MITKIFFLFQIVSSGQIRVWMVETVRGEVELAGEAVELYFHVGLDYVMVSMVMWVIIFPVFLDIC